MGRLPIRLEAGLRRILRPRRDWSEVVGASTRINHLLVVAGASGSGKSTLLRQIACREIPEVLKAALPEAASDWMQTDGIKIVRRPSLSASHDGTGRLAGAVHHYDILRPYESRIEDYAGDPNLALWGKADRITVVLLMPGSARLIAQLDHRRRRRSRVRDAARWADLVRRYEEPGWLEGWYGRWEAFIDRTVADGQAIRMTVYEPS